jgi:hypothetical protein
MRTVMLIAAMAAVTAFCGCKSAGHHEGMMKSTAMSNCPKGIEDVECGGNADCHAKKIKAEIEVLIHHMRADIKEVSEPQARAMFETSAEVLTGMAKAFEDYQKQGEKAWTK